MLHLKNLQRYDTLLELIFFIFIKYSGFLLLLKYLILINPFCVLKWCATLPAMNINLDIFGLYVINSTILFINLFHSF